MSEPRETFKYSMAIGTSTGQVYQIVEGHVPDGWMLPPCSNQDLPAWIKVISVDALESLRTENSELEDKYAELKRDWEYLGIENERLKSDLNKYEATERHLHSQTVLYWAEKREAEEQLQSEREKNAELEIKLWQHKGALGYPVPGHIVEDTSLVNGLSEAKAIQITTLCDRLHQAETSAERNFKAKIDERTKCNEILEKVTKLRAALEKITEIDGETNEALQLDAINIARSVLAEVGE